MTSSRRVRLKDVISSFSRLYDGVVAIFGAVLMTAIVIVMSVQVFFRYVLNDSLIWAEELSSYMLVLMAFLLLGAAFQRGEMMNIEMLMGRLPPRLRAAANVPVYLAMTAFLVYLSYYCYLFALLNLTASIPAIDFIVSSITGQTRTLTVSRYWLYLTVPLGLLILSVHLSVAAARDLLVAAGVVEPKPPAETEPLGPTSGAR